MARTKLYDTFNSNVVFGGVYHLVDYYTKIAYAKYVGTYECTPYTAYNRRCYEEYVTFRGSIYSGVVTPGQVEIKQRDVETGEEVRVLVDDDVSLTAATGSGQTESGWCLEEVNSSQELEEDKDKSETFGDQSPEVDGNDPNEEGSQDCQHTRQADKPQDIADLQEGISISYLYETPKTVVVRPTDEFNSYGQPKTTIVQGDDIWSMLNDQDGRTAGQHTELFDDVDPLSVTIKSSERTTTSIPTGVELVFTCVQAAVRQTVITPVELHQSNSLETHWGTMLVQGSRRMPPKLPVLGCISGDTAVSYTHLTLPTKA